MRLNVDSDIALTHLLTRKKQTMIAALGVTVGIGIFIFMISGYLYVSSIYSPGYL